MKRRAWFILLGVLVVASLVLAACGGAAPTEAPAPAETEPPAPAETEAPAPAETEAPAEEPVTVVIGTTDEISGLDPATTYAVHDWELLRNINMSLLRWKPGTAELAPGIADFPEVSDDGKTYTFTLFEGVKFCDGTELTAPLYVQQFKRAMEIEGSESGGALVDPYVESVEAVDDRTVVFRLTDSFGFFTSIATTVPYGPSHPDIFGMDGFNDFPPASPDQPLCGVGPWMITSYDPAEQAVLEPNPFYFGDDKPKVDRVIVKYFADPQTMALAMEEGEIDIAWRILGPDLRARLAEVPGLNIVRIPGGPIRYFIVNHALEPTNDPNVRKAVAALIDRDELADRVFAGQVTPLYSPIPPGFIGATDVFDEVYQAPNPDLARELLTASGYSEDNPVVLDVWYPPEHYGGTVAPAMEVVKAQLEASGMIQVNLHAQDWATYVDAVIGGEDYPMSFLGWFFDYPDSDNYVTPFGRGAGLGSNVNNDELDALLAQAAAESDPDVRAELYAQIQEMWAELIPTLPLWIEPEHIIYPDYIQGINIGPTIEFNYNTIEKVGS